MRLFQANAVTPLSFRLLLSTLLLLLLTSATLLPPALANQLVIFRSHDYVSHSYAIQHFEDTLTLQNGQLEVPLTLDLYNGAGETPAFKWFRIMINGEIIATEQDMRGRESAAKDISGLIHGSNNQVQIEAGGVPGASLIWTLTAQQIEISGAEPSQAQPGQEIRLTGSNIPSTPSMISVTFNGTPGRVISANVDSIVVQVPESVNVGTSDVQVRIGKVTCNPVALNIVSRPVPEILSINVWMAPPGGTINITGRNFSSNAEANKVSFGPAPAQVSSASSNELTVVVPNWSWGPSQLNIPITVEVNGMRSNKFPFDIGPMYHGGTPSFGHD